MKYLLSFDNSPFKPADGEYVSGEHHLRYTLDGARYFLAVSEERVYHKCEEDSGMELEFAKSGQSFGRIRCGNRLAPFPVKCHKLDITISENGFKAFLSFNWDKEPLRKIFITAKVENKLQ